MNAQPEGRCPPLMIPVLLGFMILGGSLLQADFHASATSFLETGTVADLEKWLAADPSLLPDMERANILLTQAVIANKLDMVGLLLAKGLSPNSATGTFAGQYPLHYANSGHMVDLLVKHGAKLEVKDVEEETPVHTACEFQREEVLVALVRAGARIDPSNDKDRGPIHLAAARGDAQIVGKLLELGADPDKSDGFGYTPWKYATQNKNTKVMAVLKSHSRTRQFWTVLNYTGWAAMAVLLVLGGKILLRKKG